MVTSTDSPLLSLFAVQHLRRRSPSKMKKKMNMTTTGTSSLDGDLGSSQLVELKRRMQADAGRAQSGSAKYAALKSTVDLEWLLPLTAEVFPVLLGHSSTV